MANVMQGKVLQASAMVRSGKVAVVWCSKECYCDKNVVRLFSISIMMDAPIYMYFDH